MYGIPQYWRVNKEEILFILCSFYDAHFLSLVCWPVRLHSDCKSTAPGLTEPNEVYELWSAALVCEHTGVYKSQDRLVSLIPIPDCLVTIFIPVILSDLTTYHIDAIRMMAFEGNYRPHTLI